MRMRRMRRVARRRRHTLVASVAGILVVCVAAVGMKGILSGGSATTGMSVGIDAPASEQSTDVAAAWMAVGGAAAALAGDDGADDVAMNGAGPGRKSGGVGQ